MTKQSKQASTSISVPSLKRLPAYLRFLKEVLAAGEQTISCTRIGQEFRQDTTQVRKDLAALGIAGKPRVGHVVSQLVDAIETFLGWNNASAALLVGTGNLGTALLGYQGFKQHGINIIAAFDSAPGKAGTTAHGVKIRPLDSLPAIARRAHIRVGIITVPADAAQGVADLMVQSGIQAIWNFTPAKLQLPEEVILQSEDLSVGLAVLCRRLTLVLSSK